MRERKYPWIILAFCFWLFPGLAANAGEGESGLLWRIEKPGRAPSYLFGTIHSTDPRVLKLPAAVTQRLDAAQRLILEAELSEEAILAFSTTLFLPSQQNLLGLLGNDDFVKLFTALSKRGVTYEIAFRLKPWVAMLFLNQPPPDREDFLDMVLKGRAEARGTPVYGLETLNEQTKIFDRFSPQEQLDLLRSSLKNLDKLDEMLERLHLAYLAGDLSALEKISEEYTPPEDQALTELFIKYLVDERNLRMIERVEQHLEKGNAFVAVGALHLPGGQGLLALLRAQGYRVTAVAGE